MGRGNPPFFIMKLYKQYCYENLGDVRRSILSQMSIDGFGIVQSVTSSSGVITVNYLDPSNSVNSFTFRPPNCDTLGYDNSYTGISTTDAIELGSMFTAVLVIAWTIKIIRRAL